MIRSGLGSTRFSLALQSNTFPQALEIGDLEAAGDAVAAGWQDFQARSAGLAPVSGALADSPGVGNAGDIALNAPAARSQFHLDGTGIRIGIISDSFDSATATARASNPAAGFSAAVLAEQAAGDLPSVTVLNDSAPGALAATDEGRAMAELIHKIAPGAQLYFATRGSGESKTSTAVANLQAAGADVIVDDISWSSEPLFQDGAALQKAVAAATAAGVSYFTSAGNQSSHFYETNFASRSPQLLTISTTGMIEIDLQWTQPYRTFPAGSAGSAYSLGWELHVPGTGTVVYSSLNNAMGQNPVQDLTFAIAAGSYDLVVVNNVGTANPADTLKVMVLASNPNSVSMAAGTGSGTVFGHELVSSANVVGAVNAASPTVVEPYSAFGSGTLYYDATGARLATPVIVNKPDFLGPDAIATSVAGFATFAGTSAAAPNAAAVGALLLQVNPNLTAAEIQAALIRTASTQGLVGATAQFGAGLINAQAAAELLYTGLTVQNGTTLYNGSAASHKRVLAWNQASGNWANAAAWSVPGTPDATRYVTLGDNLGALTTNYTVTIDSAGGPVGTLAIGAASAVSAALAITATGALIVAGGATVGKSGSITIAGAGSLQVGGLLQLVDTTGSAATLTLQANAHVTAGSFGIVGGVATIAAGASLVAAGTGTVGQGGVGVLGVEGSGLVGSSLAVGKAGQLTITQGGSLSVGGALVIQAGGTVEIGAGSTLIAASLYGGSFGQPGGHVTIDHGGWLMVPSADPLVLTGLKGLITTTIDHASGSSIDLRAHLQLGGLAYDGSASQTLNYSAGILTIRNGAIDIAYLSFDTAQGFTPANFSKADDGTGHLQVNIACYLRGTRIATERGERVVETLGIGDRVMTAAGAFRPVRWMGRRRYSAAEAAGERRLWPIRIAAGALGPLRPRRDLYVSPQHALLLRDPGAGHDVLVPAVQLVNGVTITHEATDAEIAYFHIELTDHDAVLAEGQAAETFVDRDSRAAFENAGEFTRLFPGAATERVALCAPRIEGGPALARIRAEIEAWGGVLPGGLAGYIDRVTAGMIEGWAHVADTPGGPVLLEIMVDDARAGILLADQFRADLAAMRGGHCAFFFIMPAGWAVARDSRVSVRRMGDGRELARTAASVATDGVALVGPEISARTPIPA